MFIEGWKYYNHAALPTTAPHEMPNLKPIDDGTIWKLSGEGKPLFARWTTNWDTTNPTCWWYVIKDTSFDISALKSKRRYEINKGKKNFIVSKINPLDYCSELYDITIKAYSGWPEKYRPTISVESFEKQCISWSKLDVFAGFSSMDNSLAGYAVLFDNKTFIDFSILRTVPDYERLAINAAMVAGILEYYNDRFDGSFYINDGARSIRHETAFQDYLEKYFGFRKAYCQLNIKYRPIVGIIVYVLFPFRNLINGDSSFGSNLKSLMLMEELVRTNNE